MTNGKEKTGLILALDLDDTHSALKFLDSWGANIQFVKIGPGLFSRGGIPFITRLREGGWEIFLDIKLHDIPNTVAAAIKALSAENIWAATLHTSGGSAMMSAAADIRDDKRPLLFGVTVLTSHDSKTWEEVNPGCSMERALLKRAESAMSSHMDGIVCSPRELPMFGQRDFESLLKIVPGVRPVDYVMNDDQKRIATPADAARGGADFVVVGRPITQAADPGEVIDAILEELKQ